VMQDHLDRLAKMVPQDQLDRLVSLVHRAFPAK